MDNTHFSALEAKHAGLEALIVTEQRRPVPDELTLATLKKQKLKIKEAITAR